MSDIIGKLTVYGRAHYAFHHPVVEEGDNPTRHKDLEPGYQGTIKTDKGDIQLTVHDIPPENDGGDDV